MRQPKRQTGTGRRNLEGGSGELSRRTRGVWTLDSQKDRLTKAIHLEYCPLTYPYFFVYQVLNCIGASNCAFLTATCGAAAGREPGLLQAGNARSSRLYWHIFLHSTEAQDRRSKLERARRARFNVVMDYYFLRVWVFQVEYG